MKIHRSTRLFRGQLDLAPYLCVLSFLAFAGLAQGYLVLPRGTRLALPASESEAATRPGEVALVVAVDAANRIFFENQITTLPQLEVALANRVRAGGPRLLLIQSDRSVAYGQLVELVAIARRSGLKEAILGGLPDSRP